MIYIVGSEIKDEMSSIARIKNIKFVQIDSFSESEIYEKYHKLTNYLNCIYETIIIGHVYIDCFYIKSRYIDRICLSDLLGSVTIGDSIESGKILKDCYIGINLKAIPSSNDYLFTKGERKASDENN